MKNKCQEALELLYGSAVDNFIGLEDCETIEDCKRNDGLKETEYYKTIQEFIDKEDHYRWHDIKKNPTDFPTDKCGIIILCYGPKEEEKLPKYYSIIQFNNGPLCLSHYDSTYDIIAWKYIDKFDDEQISRK